MMSLIMSPCINWLWLGLIITSATALGGCVRRIATCMDQLQEISYTSSNQLGTPVPLRHDLWDSDYLHTYHTLFKRTRGTSCWNGYLAIPKRCHHGLLTAKAGNGWRKVGTGSYFLLTTKKSWWWWCWFSLVKPSIIKRKNQRKDGCA